MLDHISSSAMTLFDTCALQYRGLRIDKIPELPSKPLITGRLAHSVIEAYLKELRDSDLDRYPGAIQGLVQAVFTASDIASTEYYNDVLITAMTFAKSWTMKPGDVLEIEMRCEHELGDGYPKLLSFLDFVAQYPDSDDAYFIGATDFKTGWAADQSEANEFQLEVQGFQLHQRYPDVKIGVRNHFVRQNKVTPWKFMSEWDYDRIERRVKVIYDRMELAYKKRNYPANPGKQCDYCPLTSNCDVFKKLVATKQKIDNAETAQDRLRQVVVSKAVVKQFTKQLKEYVNAFGSVTLASGTASAGFSTPKDGITIEDKPAAYNAIGEEIWDLLNWDAKALKKQEEDPRLEDLWIGTTGSARFGITGSIDEDE